MVEVEVGVVAVAFSMLPAPMFWVPELKKHIHSLYILICLKQLNDWATC